MRQGEDRHQGMAKRRLCYGCHSPIEHSSHGLPGLKGSTGAFHLLRRPPAKTDPETAFASQVINSETEAVSECRFLEQLADTRTEVARPGRRELEPVWQSKATPGALHHCSPAGRPCGRRDEYAAGLAQGDKFC